MQLFDTIDVARLEVEDDPTGLANPGKVLPSPAGCGDLQHVPEGAWV